MAPATPIPVRRGRQNFPQIDTNVADNQQNDTKERLKQHKELMEGVQQKISAFLESMDGELPTILVDVLRQASDDIAFAVRAVTRVCESGDTVLARMVIGARLNSQQYQRAYTITDSNILNNPDSYYSMNTNGSQGVTLSNPNAYSPFTPSVTRTVSIAINTQSQNY
jgi:hypothetical protein